MFTTRGESSPTLVFLTRPFIRRLTNGSDAGEWHFGVLSCVPSREHGLRWDETGMGCEELRKAAAEVARECAETQSVKPSRVRSQKPRVREAPEKPCHALTHSALPVQKSARRDVLRTCMEPGPRQVTPNALRVKGECTDGICVRCSVFSVRSSRLSFRRLTTEYRSRQHNTTQPNAPGPRRLRAMVDRRLAFASRSLLARLATRDCLDL